TEEGLAGLWNFDDPANPANDATPAGNHGQLRGQARILETALPTASALPLWSRLSVKLTDIAGTTVSGVMVRALTNGVELARSAPSATDGLCAVTLWGMVSAVAL